jgi:predicted outer membrane repeat protein
VRFETDTVRACTVWTACGACRQRHIAMVGLHATLDSLGNFCDGGALRVLRSNLTIEHCVFAHNKADGGGAVKASGTIRIFNTVFKNNTVRKTLASSVGVATTVVQATDCEPSFCTGA